MSPDLSSLGMLRMHVDALDSIILRYLAKRHVVVNEILQLKLGGGVPIRDQSREHEVLEKIRRCAKQFDLPEHIAETIFRTVMDQFTRAQCQQSVLEGPPVIVIGRCQRCSWRTSAIQGGGKIACCSRCKTPLEVS